MDEIMKLGLKNFADEVREIADKIENAYDSDAPAISLVILWPELEDVQKKLRLYTSMIATMKA